MFIEIYVGDVYGLRDSYGLFVYYLQEYFKCPYDEKCKMDVSNRRFCKRCRLKKCFEIGMRKEYILTDEEKAKKRLKIEENRCEKRSQT
ncbi:hypothetical protein LSH36_36g04032 [Paralvinella palmiformis]|uniref:Nuclear receptor domain-containing protein n=1 Tax=Paralvinella palmiformis TaxID=53620 RepID=A0AAD9K8D2_9ANNE|nr:hypothetical protein LSH36_36g04032 [Paralvinella palmiformis]